ncbi:MAG: hypothetical protein ABI910_05100 [Gemmatimonadota bacterium]
MLALGAGCVTVTTRAFLPSPHNPLYTPARAEPVLTDYLRLQCEPLRKSQRPDSGTARFIIDVDTAGFATRAEMQRGTGDDTLDGVFGTVAAQLTFERAAKARREHVDLLYACTGDDAHVTVRTGGA